MIHGLIPDDTVDENSIWISAWLTCLIVLDDWLLNDGIHQLSTTEQLCKRFKMENRDIA